MWSAKGSWSPSTNSSCDLNEYWDFFEDSGTVKAVQVLGAASLGCFCW